MLWFAVPHRQKKLSPHAVRPKKLEVETVSTALTSDNAAG
jgi:hypothetical protein